MNAAIDLDYRFIIRKALEIREMKESMFNGSMLAAVKWRRRVVDLVDDIDDLRHFGVI